MRAANCANSKSTVRRNWTSVIGQREEGERKERREKREERGAKGREIGG